MKVELDDVIRWLRDNLTWDDSPYFTHGLIADEGYDVIEGVDLDAIETALKKELRGTKQ